MSKLLDMFAQARRAQGGSGMGFLGKNRQETKPRAAAIVIELATADVSNAEAALKAGADGLLFTWDGKSRPSAPALSAASALLTSAVASSMTIAAALGFVSCLFFPKKPIPLPPCARRACANMSSSLLIFFCNSLLFYITFASFVERVRDV